MSITKLKDRQLYTVCDPQKFDFASTAELEERMSALGQDRAISAVKLGINIKSKGYNLFCLGPEGTGKTSLVKRILEEAAKTRPTPRDWVYVYNFDEPYKPKSISFPAGTACEFAKDIWQRISALPFRRFWTVTNTKPASASSAKNTNRKKKNICGFCRKRPKAKAFPCCICRWGWWWRRSKTARS